jgi:cystathionine beta-lyase
MAQFDFDKLVNRRHTDSIKWRQPDDVLPMWVADTDFLAPPQVIAALQQRVSHGIFGYHHESPTLRATVVAWVAHRYGWSIEPEWILFLPDVMRGVNLAAQTLARPGDGILVQTPVYAPFFDVVRNARCIQQDAPLVADASGRYHFDMDALEAAVTPETSVFLLCSPQNPTGRVFSRPELEAIAAFCQRHQLSIISDDIHADLIFSEAQHTPIASLDADLARRTATFIAPSKTFNLAGLKAAVGIVPDAELRQRMQAQHRGLMARVNLLGQVAMETAYSQGAPWLDAMRLYLQDNRDFLLAFIAAGQLPGVRMARPDGTFLAWLDFSKTAWAHEPARHIREQARVVVNEGTWFGDAGAGFARLNFGCPRATLEEGLTRIQQAMARHQSRA